MYRKGDSSGKIGARMIRIINDMEYFVEYELADYIRARLSVSSAGDDEAARAVGVLGVRR